MKRTLSIKAASPSATLWQSKCSAFLDHHGHWTGDKTDEEGELMVKELQRKCLNGELQVAIFFWQAAMLHYCVDL
jgi:hypothetical protein